MLKKLPIGIQTFSHIVKQNYLYIDKTKMALELIEEYKYVFLSRPRRFGKSLFLDTLQEIFEGNKEIFEGLYIYDKYKFENYPVIKIDWAGDFKTLRSTKEVATRILEKNQERLGIKCKPSDNIGICLDRLIQEAYKKYQKPVVILIDEYDKPILDNIDNTQRANENRDLLKSIYIQLKSNDRYIKFAFLTGITKFSKASIFSGLNNLEDISLTPTFGNICGYTQKDVESSFLSYLKDVDLARVKEWYNGYNFLGDSVYNPFDILKFIKNGHICKNYWWESGSPYGLIEILKNKNYYLPSLQNLRTNEMLLNSFDITDIQLEGLLFQAGYLTIDYVEDKRNRLEYILKVPNMEVQISLNELFIRYMSGGVNIDIRNSIYDALQDANLQEFKNQLVSLFASIPYNNYTKNSISHFEGYYSSVIYAYLASLGLNMVAEDVSNTGRIDLTLMFEEKVYIVEFKVGSADALQQIREKKYYQKYLKSYKQIYLIGINFDENEKNISNFKWEKL